MLRPSLAVAACALALSIARGSILQPQPQPGDGRLLIIVVVDQMRADYLERYRHYWKEGIARLLEQGAVRWLRATTAHY